MSEKICVVVAWWNEEQIERFLSAWGIELVDAYPMAIGDRLEAIGQRLDWLVLQRDVSREGCARTKNKGVQEAIRRGADIVVVLDDDCFPDLPVRDIGPAGMESQLQWFARLHQAQLVPQSIPLFAAVTEPPSRGTPYHQRHVVMPVAASMGFWTDIGDYDALGQLVHGATKPMTFHQEPVFGRYFPLCGMNLAFRPKDWLPWCEFIDVPRFDDIWMGWLWQREAYARGYCFNLNGPLVRHSRQSNVWANLRAEAVHLERNETLWRDIATYKETDYASLRKLLPV